MVPDQGWHIVYELAGKLPGSVGLFVRSGRIVRSTRLRAGSPAASAKSALTGFMAAAYNRRLSVCSGKVNKEESLMLAASHGGTTHLSI